ncbi:MAG: hypothetical protein M1819_004874 [Sarea resinae]|nr:MAG: hypothetical protein M1819_004874 [Sarea resinae]
MAPSIPSPSLRIPIEPLTQSSFAPFGTVIENPGRSSSTHPQSPHQSVAASRNAPSSSTSPVAVSANQGTALKYVDVTQMADLYGAASSGQRGKAVMNMFVCAPRELRPDTSPPSLSLQDESGKARGSTGRDDDIEGLFDVRILERHPFTSQTFIPVGLAARDNETSYLVIVAPTLPISKQASASASWSSSSSSSNRPPPYPVPQPRKRRRSLKDIFSSARPSPFTNSAEPPTPHEHSTSAAAAAAKGPGLPDLANARAFLARGSQAVTYGPGTWHAPMVVLGREKIDFVVVQFANGVGDEDCQEVEIRTEGVGEGLAVVVPRRLAAGDDGSPKAKL